MLHRKTQIYLALLTAGFLGMSLLVTALAERLPHGNYAPLVMWLFLAVAGTTGVVLLRVRRQAHLLLAGDLLEMEASEIPRRSGQTYIGHSFVWKPHHAQQLYGYLAHGIEPSEQVQAALGGNVLIHGLGAEEEAPLYISDRKRAHHMLVLGSPGEGKTRCLELIVRQLIEQGDVVVIIDPKGDDRLISLVRQVCDETGRSQQFRLFAPPWPTASVAYNPLAHFGNPSDLADRLIGLFPPAGGGDSEAFRGFQWGAAKAVLQAMYLTGTPITIARTLRYLRNPGEILGTLVKARFPDLAGRDLGETVAKYESLAAGDPKHRSPELDDLLAYVKLDPTYYSKMVASFLPQLERLSAGPKRELLSPEPEETTREVLSWQSIDKRKLVVYCYLGSLHGEESANAVGKMMLLDLEAYIAARYSYQADGDRHRLSLVVDEAHHMVSKPFMNVLAEARGANLAVALSSQTLAQFEQSMGSRAAVEEVLTHHFLHLQFQTRNPREAEDFSKLAGDRLLRVVGESFRYEPGFFDSGDRNVSDFKAVHTLNIQEKEAALVPPFAIVQLPTFHYFARMGGRIYKGRIPLLSAPKRSYVRDLQEKVAS